MKTKQVEQKGTYLRAFRAAFPYTVPVLTGYLFIGMAFGVMIQEKGYNFLSFFTIPFCWFTRFEERKSCIDAK